MIIVRIMYGDLMMRRKALREKQVGRPEKTPHRKTDESPLALSQKGSCSTVLLTLTCLLPFTVLSSYHQRIIQTSTAPETTPPILVQSIRAISSLLN